MSYQRHILQCNLYQAEHFLTFKVNGIAVGAVKHYFAEQLLKLSGEFKLDEDSLVWEPKADGFEALNISFKLLTKQLVSSGIISRLHGELYPVTAGQREQVLFLMDRAVVPYFGIRAFGQHLNGYIKRNGEIHMWIGRRSRIKPHAPGKLDHLVAGGLPYGLSLQENLAKECWEEAGISPELASHAEAKGHIAYRRETEIGLKPDTMYCYDLELSEDFTPRCTDGEVEEFYLWPLEKVAQLVHDTDEFKLNCNLAIIDFLIRQEFITPQHPEYTSLIDGLR